MEREFNFGPMPEDPFEKKGETKEEKKSSKKEGFMENWLEKRAGRTLLSREKEAPEKPKEVRAEIEEKTPRELASEYVSHRVEQLEEAVTTSPSEETRVENQADLKFVQAIQEKIEEPSKEVEPAIEEAYHELMEAFGEEPSQTEGAPEEIEGDSNPAEVVPSEGPGDSKERGAIVPRSIPKTARATNPVPAQKSAPTPPFVPPLTPELPSINRGGSPAHTQEIPPASPTETGRESYGSDKQRQARKVLVAGAVGYMLGRRRGGKKAEAKLKPEIKKQEAIIRKLEKNIEQKEFHIREAARENLREQAKVAPQPSTEKEHKPSFTAPERKVHQESQQPEVTPNEKPRTPERTETAPVAITPEKPNRDTIRAIQEAKDAKPQQRRAPEKRVEQLPTTVLLHMAESIIVMGTSVRKLYETNQITRHGLEHIVKEHLAGHDISPMLDKHLLGKEAIQERAHEYRHDPALHSTGGSDDTAVDSQAPQQPVKHRAESSRIMHDVHPWNPPKVLDQSTSDRSENATLVTAQKTPEASTKVTQKSTGSVIVIIALGIVLLLFGLLFVL